MEPIRALIKVIVAGKPEEFPATCLGCFGVVDEGDITKLIKKGYNFLVVHLKSGLINSDTYPSEEEALAYIRDISTVKDWNLTDPNADGINEQERAIAKIHARKTTILDVARHGTADLLGEFNEHAIRPCNLENNS